MSSSQANIQPVVDSHVNNNVNNTLSVSKNPSDEKPDKFNGTCHAPDPSPTRLANPNRFRGAKPYTGTPYLFKKKFFIFFLS